MLRNGWLRRFRPSTVVTVIAAALVLAALCVLFLRARVCDEQLTTAGDRVSVCRHLQLTDPPLALLGILLVGLLMIAFPIAEISAFGFSLKQRVDTAQAAAEQAQLAAKSAAEAAEQAELTAQLADRVAKTADETAELARATARNAKDGYEVLEERLRTREPQEQPDHRDMADILAPLIAEYDQIRMRDPHSNAARTARLTAVVGRMIAALDGAERDSIDVASALESHDLGVRLAAYAYFYVIADRSKVPLLVNAVVNEPQEHRFGQYWGLRAIRQQVLATPGALDENSRRELERLQRSLGPRTDRAFELGEVLQLAQGKPSRFDDRV